jgi:hypothetical protein
MTWQVCARRAQQPRRAERPPPAHERMDVLPVPTLVPHARLLQHVRATPSADAHTVILPTRTRSCSANAPPRWRVGPLMRMWHACLRTVFVRMRRRGGDARRLYVVNDLVPHDTLKARLALPHSLACHELYAGLYDGRPHRSDPQPLASASALEQTVRVPVAAARLWMSGGNTTSSLHFDTHDNVLLQIDGAKEVLLWHPNASAELYMDRTRSEAQPSTGGGAVATNTGRGPTIDRWWCSGRPSCPDRRRTQSRALATTRVRARVRVYVFVNVCGCACACSRRRRLPQVRPLSYQRRPRRPRAFPGAHACHAAAPCAPAARRRSLPPQRLVARHHLDGTQRGRRPRNRALRDERPRLVAQRDARRPKYPRAVLVRRTRHSQARGAQARPSAACTPSLVAVDVGPVRVGVRVVSPHGAVRGLSARRPHAAPLCRPALGAAGRRSSASIRPCASSSPSASPHAPLASPFGATPLSTRCPAAWARAHGWAKRPYISE